MTKFSVNPDRRAPYKRFKFRVKWDGRYVPGVSRVSGLRRTTEPVFERSGSDPTAASPSPGPTSYEPVVLERGRTHDRAFEQWADRVYDLGAGAGAEVSLGDYRKDVVVELYNEAGQLVMAFVVYGAWPGEYTALGELDATDGATATESLTLYHEGWERDPEVTEPEEYTAGSD
jgi:phage tail-like protein